MRKRYPATQWATWPPKSSLYLARLAWPDKDLILSQRMYQKMGAAQVNPFLHKRVSENGGFQADGTGYQRATHNQSLRGASGHNVPFHQVRVRQALFQVQ